VVGRRPGSGPTQAHGGGGVGRGASKVEGCWMSSSNRSRWTWTRMILPRWCQSHKYMHRYKMRGAAATLEVNGSSSCAACLIMSLLSRVGTFGRTLAQLAGGVLVVEGAVDFEVVVAVALNVMGKGYGHEAFH